MKGLMFQDKVLRNIFLISIASVIILAAYIIFFIVPSFTDLLNEVSEDDSTRIARHLMSSLLSENTPLEKGALSDAFKKRAELLKNDFGLMKVVIFSSSGETIYSSDFRDVGRTISEAFFRDVVAKGKIFRESVKENDVSASGQRVTSDVIETYVPIMKDGRFAGACEVYMDVTARRARNFALLLKSFSALAVLGLGLLIAVAIVSSKANKSIEARRKLEDTLKENEHFLQTIIETEPECVKLLDRDGTLLKMNRAGLSMIEADSFDQVKGRPVSALISEDHRHAFDELNSKVFQGQSGTLEFEMAGLKGRRLWLETHAVPLFNEKGEIVASLAITRDITMQKQAVAALQNEISERRKAEEEIRILNHELRLRAAQLEQSYADLESFSVTASHDLREPLIVIEWFSNNLLKKYGNKLDDDAKESVALIKDKARQMAQLINDLLSFSRVSTKAVSRSLIDMKGLFENVFSEMKAAVGDREVQFVVSDTPSAWGDPQMIRQVLVNLLSNALKYTRTRASAHIEIGGLRGESENSYYVRDNGIGFGGDDSANLFGLFQRLKTSQGFEGTGVGLAIVKRIIEKHGGRVWAEGKVDGGATFSFSLPSEKSLRHAGAGDVKST